VRAAVRVRSWPHYVLFGALRGAPHGGADLPRPPLGWAEAGRGEPRLAYSLLKMGMFTPVSGAAASLSRKATMAATSSGVTPGLRCGAARRSIAVSTAPGLR